MKQLEEVVQALSAPLKQRGYKKNRLTWYKEKEKLTVVFSLEKSQYGADTWYYWFGICLHDIASSKSRTMANCQIKYRIDRIVNQVVVPEERLVSLLERWEAMYGQLRSLRRSALQGNLPPMTAIPAVRYLTSVDLSQFGGDG